MNHACATMDQILGGNGHSAVNPRWEAHVTALQQMRERLLQRRGDLGELRDDSTHTPNPADRGTDEYDAGAHFSQFSSDQEALFEIEEALRRIEIGSYGLCEATGRPIPPERLEAAPWTRFAKEVELEIERQLAARKPKHVF